MFLFNLHPQRRLSSEISESNCFFKRLYLIISKHKSEHYTLTWKVLQNTYFNQVGVIHHKLPVLF